jgi:hypothetical protein
MLVGGTSIQLPHLHVLEVLPKPTLTLFVKKPFLFWRKKFSEEKTPNGHLRPKADIQATPKYFLRKNLRKCC